MKSRKDFVMYRFQKVEWKATFLQTKTCYDSVPKASADFLTVSYFTQKN